MKRVFDDSMSSQLLINKNLKQPGGINNYLSSFKFPEREDTFDAFFVHF